MKILVRFTLCYCRLNIVIKVLAQCALVPIELEVHIDWNSIGTVRLNRLVLEFGSNYRNAVVTSSHLQDY